MTHEVPSCKTVGKAATRDPKTPQGQPKGAQECPKTPQREPKGPPRHPKGNQSWRKDGQMEPNGVHRDPRETHGIPKGSPRRFIYTKLPINRPSGRYLYVNTKRNILMKLICDMRSTENKLNPNN